MVGSGETVLSRLHKNGITATDVATQFWCERQMELNCVHKPTPTKAMEKGARMHQVWQAKVFVPLTVETRNYPDVLYKNAYENVMTLRKLHDDQMGRELMIHGSLNGYKLTGKIDELHMKDGKVVIAEDKTVRQGMTIDSVHSRPHIVQIMLYRKMFDDIKTKRYTYDNFANIYKLKDARMSEEFVKGLRELNIKEELMTLEGMHRQMFLDMQNVPELSENLHIRYVDRQSGKNAAELNIKYDPAEIDTKIAYAMGFWRGDRPSAPVEEAESWKCRACKFFGKECTVWWKEGLDA